MKDKIYFSSADYDSGWDYNNIDKTMYVVLIPSKWWSIKEWILAFGFMKSFYIVGMARKDGK